MAVLIGVDEAGYGPNYGPLCVAATAWRVDQESGVRSQESVSRRRAPARPTARAGASPPPATTVSGFPDLYKLLRKAVVRTPDKLGRKLAISDSKALYKAGFGVQQLERGVLAALAAMGTAVGKSQCIERVSELLAATAADPFDLRRELSCHEDDSQTLPLEAEVEEICRLAAKLREACDESGVSLLAIRARLVYPTEFNSLIEHYGNKGAALSHITLGLVRHVVDEIGAGEDSPARSQLTPDCCPLTPDSYFICLDKHGGRNRYAALLQHHFPEGWVEAVSEHRNLSRYRWHHGQAPVEAIFRVGCEELLPTALASMTAKYHREVAMRTFNAFWTARLPQLRPTAGYPGDSHRFRADIARVQQELGIEDRVLWRCR
jgi:hypothetical protein